MPLLSKVKWPKKKDRDSVPQLAQPQTLGNFVQPSTSTVNTSVGTASSSWNSQISLPSNPPVHRHYNLGHVPEHPDDIRPPAELEAHRNQQRWSRPVSPISPPASQTPPHTSQSPPHLSQFSPRAPHLSQRASQFSPPAPQVSSPPPQFSPPPRYERFHHTQQRDTHFGTYERVEPDVIAVTREKDMVIAQENDLERERNASAENVRRLRELIRQKYALDLYVWQKRNVAKANRKKILPKCEEADRIYQEIIWIVNGWSENQFDAEEWRMVRRIQTALLSRQLANGESNEPAYWDNLKPWERKDDSLRG